LGIRNWPTVWNRKTAERVDRLEAAVEELTQKVRGLTQQSDEPHRQAGLEPFIVAAEPGWWVHENAPEGERSSERLTRVLGWERSSEGLWRPVGDFLHIGAQAWAIESSDVLDSLLHEADNPQELAKVRGRIEARRRRGPQHERFKGQVCDFLSARSTCVDIDPLSASYNGPTLDEFSRELGVDRDDIYTVLVNLSDEGYAVEMGSDEAPFWIATHID
jgi:hypothetical protein